jgi:hypothetical protein
MTLLKELVDSSEEVWGDPEQNRGLVVPFGIGPVDERIPGIPVQRGGLFGIQGQPGTRKTTLVCNILINQCLSQKLPPGYHICVDTLESGMTIERYSDVILSMLATRILVYWHWNQSVERDVRKLFALGLPAKPIEELVTRVGSFENGRFVKETELKPEFFQFGRRTKRQHEAIGLARSIMRTWPMLICGVSEHPDPQIAAARTVNVTNLSDSYKRWVKYSKELNMRQLIVDHLQEYHVGNGSDFERMKLVVHAIAAWQKPVRGVAWVISQVGVTSAREARQSGVKAHAQGGQVLEAEAQYMTEVQYKEDNPHTIHLRRPLKSRIGVHPSVDLSIEPNSGAFIGPAVEYRRL